MAKKKSVIVFAKTKEVRFGDLKPNPDNPRINEDGIPKVKESIKKYGMNQDIAVDKDNNIIAGHTRYEALKALGVKDDDMIPVKVLDHLNEKQSVEYGLVDNKSAEYSGWDFEKVEFIIKDLDLAEDLAEWFPIMDEDDTEVAEDNGDTADTVEDAEVYEPEEQTEKKTIVCPHCGEVIEL